jgi:hypothetical protein
MEKAAPYLAGAERLDNELIWHSPDGSRSDTALERALYQAFGLGERNLALNITAVVSAQY